MVVLYLGAIVAANLLVARFGPGVSVVNAFLFIGFDLTCRDALHERWHRRHLAMKMATLIAAGGLVSWFLNRDAGRIALASVVAFTLAALTDWVVYRFVRTRLARQARMNVSNLFSAAVDSVAFPTLAFGVLLPAVVVGQYLAKVGGGALWAWIVNAATRKQSVADPSPLQP
jgi:uncharacterized PurR-regulated membrane protein YhhQ (DUF165 family)